jgi:hypothetical protein
MPQARKTRQNSSTGSSYQNDSHSYQPGVKCFLRYVPNAASYSGNIQTSRRSAGLLQQLLQ